MVLLSPLFCQSFLNSYFYSNSPHFWQTGLSRPTANWVSKGSLMHRCYLWYSRDSHQSFSGWWKAVPLPFQHQKGFWPAGASCFATTSFQYRSKLEVLEVDKKNGTLTWQVMFVSITGYLNPSQLKKELNKDEFSPPPSTWSAPKTAERQEASSLCV